MTLYKAALASCASIVALAIAAPTCAYAADTEVDELVVTARKRDEALIDVPFSVAAQSEQMMRNRGINNVEDLSRTVASFSVQNLGPGQSQVAIRGISAGQIVRDQPGVKEQVGVYLDESVISLSLFTPDLDLFDLNRVEVLRGPQGTLFGSGSLSGTLRYITNQPTLGKYEGTIEATLNKVEHGDVGGDLKGAVNIPIGETAALRITAYDTQFPGFIDAIQPDGSVKHDVNDGWRRGVRAALVFKPNENLTITPRVLYQKIDVDGFNRVDTFNILANEFTTTRPPVQLGGLKQFTQLKEKFTDEFFLADLNVQYDMGDVRLTSISSYTHRDLLVLRDATSLTGSITVGIDPRPAVYTLDAPLADTTKLKTFTQELRLSSNNDGPFQWVVGGFYSHIDRDYAQDLFVNGFSALTGIPTASTVAPTDHLYFSTVPYKQKQYAIFGEATYSVTERLDITAGLRYADYKENRTLTFDGIFAEKTIGVPGKTKADSLAPRVIAAFKATDDITLNAQVSKGFRLGGINDPLNRPLCTPADFATFSALSKPSFKNETVWNYEGGMKAKLNGGRGALTVAGFYADISNLQATIDAGTCSSRVIANVKSAKSAGFDAEFVYNLSDNFDVAATASYNDAKLTSSLLDAAGRPIQGLRDGNRLPTVPKWQTSLSLGYKRDISSTGLEAFSNLTWAYVGKRFTQISDQEDNPRLTPLFPAVGATTVSVLSFPLELPSYDIVNLRIGVRGDGWEGSLFVNNLGDERARLAIDRERGLRARYGFLTNPPRTWGATVRKEF